MLEWICRILLAVVFTVAGLTKLLDLAGTRRAVSEFGVPPRVAPTVAVVVPLAELATAALLVIPSSAWWGAVAALVLLAVFSVAIAVNLGKGRTPDCHCFGQVRSQPLNRRMLVRNVALAVPAFLLVVIG